MPVVGRRDIALNWDGTPALIIETLEVTQTRYCDVDESFALAEGENKDLKGWRRDHWQYFERHGGFDNKMMRHRTTSGTSTVFAIGPDTSLLDQVARHCNKKMPVD